MIFNIRLTAVHKYIFLPVIHIMDIALAGSNNSEDRGCNSLLLTPHHAYLLNSNLCNTLRNSVDYVPNIII